MCQFLINNVWIIWTVLATTPAAEGTRGFKMSEYIVFINKSFFKNMYIYIPRLLADYNLFAKELGVIFNTIILRANLDNNDNWNMFSDYVVVQ